MSIDELLLSFETLLEEERRAVVGMDADKVLELSQKKQGYLARLASQPRDALRERGPLMKTITAQIRENCILLAHARDCVRDAIAAGTCTSPESAARGHRLSISG